MRSSRSGVSEGNTISTEDTWISQGGTAYKGKLRRERKYAKPKTYTMPAAASGSQTARILLTGKLQLPEGFGGKSKVNRTESSIEEQIKGLSLTKTLDPSNEIVNVENMKKESDGEDSEEDTIDIPADGNDAPVTSRRKETPEEKKLRKQLVKEEKRRRRGFKKEMKIAYKSEYLTQITKHANSQDINSVRVYKYTV